MKRAFGFSPTQQEIYVEAGDHETLRRCAMATARASRCNRTGGSSVGIDGGLPHCNRDNADSRWSRAISYGKSLRLASSTTPTFRAGTNPI